MEQTNLTYHGAGWARALANEIDQAQAIIYLSALSMLVPMELGTDDMSALYRALRAAAARGVRVVVHLASPNTFTPASRCNVLAMRRLTADGMPVRLIGGPGLLHAKTCIIDRHAVWIGSGNMTAAAANSNHEAYLRADAPAIAEELMRRWDALK